MKTILLILLFIGVTGFSLSQKQEAVVDPVDTLLIGVGDRVMNKETGIECLVKVVGPCTKTIYLCDEGELVCRFDNQSVQRVNVDNYEKKPKQRDGVEAHQEESQD